MYVVMIDSADLRRLTPVMWLVRILPSYDAHYQTVIMWLVRRVGRVVLWGQSGAQTNRTRSPGNNPFLNRNNFMSVL